MRSQCSECVGAGLEIIAANLVIAEGQDLDHMRRGNNSDCAFGFCDIRQFSDTVECLQVQASEGVAE